MATKSDQHIGKAPRMYFHTMLNMADDELNPYEYRLLGHYMRVAGDNGACWEGTRTTAKKCQMSVGKVVSTRRTLQIKGYVTIEERPDETLYIEIADRWSENITRYAEKRSPDEHPVHTVNTPVHVVNERRTIEEKPKEKEIAPPSGDAGIKQVKVKKERERNHLFDAVALHMFGMATVSQETGGRVAQVANYFAGTYTGIKGRKVEPCNPPASPDEVARLAAWCHRKGYTPPRDYVKAAENLAIFRAEAVNPVARTIPLAPVDTAPLNIPAPRVDDYMPLDEHGMWIGGSDEPR